MWSRSQTPEESTSRLALPPPPAFFQKPPAPHYSTNLTINVPEHNNSDDDSFLSDRSSLYAHGHRLDAPIRLSLPLSPRATFERLTQLPTPVLNNGLFSSFGSHLPPHESIEILKRGSMARTELPVRIVSDYRPANVLGRKNSLLDLASESPSKRLVSNPQPRREISPNIPSPPLDAEPAPQHRYFAAQTGRTYRYVEQIGTGNFSTVVLAHDPERDQDIAVKVISVPLNKEAVHNFTAFITRELNILHQIDHPCIVKLVDYTVSLPVLAREVEDALFFESDNDHDNFLPPSEPVDYALLSQNSDQLLFLNYCLGRNLLQFLMAHYKMQKRESTYWAVIQRCVAEILLAVGYLHSKRIIHRDIKLENVLLTGSLDELYNQVAQKSPQAFANLTDFGLSKKLRHPDDMLHTRCGSQDYILPEILLGVKYDGRLTDAWLLGVLVYALLENRLPFDLPPLDAAAAAASGISPLVLQRRRLRKNNAAHRIAMVDWEWFVVHDVVAGGDEATKKAVGQLMRLVEVFLVRKDRRLTVQAALESPEFAWVHETPVTTVT